MKSPVKRRFTAFSYPLLLVMPMFLLVSVLSAKADVWEYQYTSPHFTDGYGKDFTNYENMYLSFSFTTTLSPSDIYGDELATGAPTVDIIPYNQFTMTDTVRTYKYSDTYASYELDLGVTPSGAITLWTAQITE